MNFFCFVFFGNNPLQALGRPSYIVQYFEIQLIFQPKLNFNTAPVLLILDFHIGDEAIDKPGYGTKVMYCRT